MLQPDEISFDVVIVGAGPAGLSAARTVARLGYKTLVVERMSEPGELGHICNAIILPNHELTPGERALGGLYFPQVDLLVPGSLIISEQAQQKYLAPGGNEFLAGAGSDGSTDSATDGALIDKPGLLRLLADQAQAAGAHFMWGTSAIGLLYQGARVCGIRTAAGDINADIVIAAEGASHALCEEAGLFPNDAHTGRRALVLAQELDAPAVGPGQLGRIVTLGRLYSSAPAGFGTLLMPAVGRAIMMFTLLVDDIDCATASMAWQYLAEFAHDQRICDLLKDACVVRRSSYLMPMGEAPTSTVRDGLLGVGDSVTPGGYLGILPAIYLGRQAALVAAGALDEGDTTAAALQDYDTFYQELIAPGLQAEARGVEALLEMSDDELDRLSMVLNWLHMPLPFFGGRGSAPAETLNWLGGQLAIDEEDLALVSRVFGAPAQVAEMQAVPAFLPSRDGASVSF